MNKIVLEILVDKANEKGPGIFEHILIVLHNVFEDFSKRKSLGEGLLNQPSFSFEMTKIGNRIRFFIVVPEKYKNFFKNQVYAHFNDVEILEVGDYLEKIPKSKIQVGVVKLSRHYLFPIKTFTEIGDKSGLENVDPFSSITSSISRTGKYTLNTFQINFSPIPNKLWKKKVVKTINIITSNHKEWIQRILLSKKLLILKIILFPLFIIYKIFSLFFKKTEAIDESNDDKSKLEEVVISNKTVKIPNLFVSKLTKLGFETNINLIHAGEDEIDGKSSIKEIFSTLGMFTGEGMNSFKLSDITSDYETITNIKNRNIISGTVLNSSELAGFVHLPTNGVKTPGINWVCARAFEPPSNLPIIDPDLTDDIVPETDLTPLGKTNFRGTNMSFGMGPNDRRRHVYIIGKTGMGKSTLLENMIIDDIHKGRGVAVIDPHGDLAEAVIGHIPKNRTNQAIIFDPSDTDWPIAFNMLDNVSPEHRPLVASGIVSIFKKLFDSWGPRLEHTLRNCILALLEYPNTTLISIPLMLTSEVYRNKVVNKVSDPIVKKFWTHEFAKMAPNQKTEAAGPILNKVGQFLSSSILRNVLGQPKNSFSIRWAMDNQKIIIINLSKGKIGEDASSLLGAMMVTKFQMDAMSRADITEDKRKDFYLYVDEFQNFATDSFATILSEARKYKLNLVMANQYIDQMQESVRGAVFGNVGSLVSFQVGYHDANILKEVLGSGAGEEDLTNLSKYYIYLKQLIDGMPSQVFSASTFPPYIKNDEAFSARYKKILQVSREKYSKSRKSVEGRINKNLHDIDKQEQEWEKKKQLFEAKKKEEKAKKHKEMLEKQAKEREAREAREAIK